MIGIVVNDVRTEILRQYVKYRASLLVETDAPTFDAALQNLKYCATVRRATANVYKSRVIVYKGGRCDVTEPDIPTELWGPDIEIRGPEHFRCVYVCVCVCVCVYACTRITERVAGNRNSVCLVIADLTILTMALMPHPSHRARTSGSSA